MLLIYHQILILWTLGLIHRRNMGFGIDMARAKAIHQRNIRRSRAKRLPELDVEFIRAQESSADTSAIVAKKNALRDYPNHAGIGTAQNITELRSNWDTGILGKTPYEN